METPVLRDPWLGLMSWPVRYSHSRLPAKRTFAVAGWSAEHGRCSGIEPRRDGPAVASTLAGVHRMNTSLALKTLVAGFALSACALAQAPPPGAPLPAAGQALGAAAMPFPAQTGDSSLVTQASRVRALNPGRDGQVLSLYLANGSVVDLSPDLGQQIGLGIRRGARVRVSGVRSIVNGQTVVAANRLSVNGQTFVAQPGAANARGGANLLPPPPAGGPRRGPGRRGGPEMAGAGPQGPELRGPGRDQAPPVPGRTGPPQGPNGAPPAPLGPPPARPQGNQQAPPPPPPAMGGTQPAAPTTGVNPPAQPDPSKAPMPPAGQPPAPNAPPAPNGPAV